MYTSTSCFENKHLYSSENTIYVSIILQGNTISVKSNTISVYNKFAFALKLYFGIMNSM